MSLLFLSHSSRNNAEALALADWLESEGWTELFLDIDPERGIVAGERWEHALHEAAGRCDTVLFLISRHWLDSKWCLRELHLAHQLNKRIVALLVEELPVAELPLELTESWQVVNLATGAEFEPARTVTLPGSDETREVSFARDGLLRLRAGLRKAGLDPNSFPWPPEREPGRSPFRGLKPLQAEDAGIFFGREGPIIELLAQLRGLSEGAPPRFLAILGASGAGKSSFLRAGILPRLARDDRHYLPLPVVRPEQAVLTGPTGLVSSLVTVFKAKGLAVDRQQVIDAVVAGAPSLRPLLQALAAKSAVPDWQGQDPSPPILVLPIDQGEELFVAEGQEESRRFLRLLAELLYPSRADSDVADAFAERPFSGLMALVTIRSDSYDPLQSAPELEGILQKTFSLPPIPRGAYRQVIEEPARLLARSRRPLKIDPKLTEALLQDIERGGAKDALPLLAFTLERLYVDYGGDGDLRLDEYEALGRIEGAIETAVEQALKAAQQDPKVPRDREECLKLLRRGLIPWLAGIDPQTNLPRRKVARLGQVPEEARALIQYFIEHRLLATDQDEDKETTVEPAHEALLRQWGRLKGWLEEDAAALSTLESVKQASRDWEANARDAKWLVHQTGRLEDAEALNQRSDLAANLDGGDRSYLAECRKQEDEIRNREIKRARELAEALEESERQLVEANHNLGLALVEKAESRASASRYMEGLLLRASANSLLQNDSRLCNVRSALALRNRSSCLVWLTKSVSENGQPTHVAFSPDGTGLATGSSNGSLRILDAMTGELLASFVGHSGAIRDVVFSPDGVMLASASNDGAIKLWATCGGRLLSTLRGHSGSVNCVAFSRAGEWVASGSADKTIKIWNSADGSLRTTLRGHSDAVASLAFNQEGTCLASGAFDRAIKIWCASSGKLQHNLLGHQNIVTKVAFQPGTSTLASASTDRTIRFWELGSESAAQVLPHGGLPTCIAFSSDGRRLATSSLDQTIKIWSSDHGQVLEILKSKPVGVWSLAYSPEGARLASGFSDGTAGMWETAPFMFDGCSAKRSREVHAVTFSQDGSRLAVGLGNGSILIWDADGGALIWSFEGHRGFVGALAFSLDGARLASGSWDGTICVWDIERHLKLAQLVSLAGCVRSVAFNSDSTLLSSGHEDHKVRIWRLRFSQPPMSKLSASTWAPVTSTNGSVEMTLEGHADEVRCVAFSAGGGLLASGSADGSLILWDIKRRALLRTFGEQGGSISAVSFNPGQTRLAATSVNNTLRIWGVADGSLITSMNGRELANGIIWLPDGGRVVARRGGTNEVQVWDTADATLLESFPGFIGSDWDVALSPNGAKLALISPDGDVHVEESIAQSDLRHSWLDEFLASEHAITGVQRVGVDLVFSLDCREHPGGTRLETATNFWGARSPFYWSLKALGGHVNAMIEAGNGFMRLKQYEQARHWFEQARDKGHPKAADRLEVLSIALQRLTERKA